VPDWDEDRFQWRDEFRHTDFALTARKRVLDNERCRRPQDCDDEQGNDGGAAHLTCAQP